MNKDSIYTLVHNAFYIVYGFGAGHTYACVDTQASRKWGSCAWIYTDVHLHTFVKLPYTHIVQRRAFVFSFEPFFVSKLDKTVSDVGFFSAKKG